MEFSSIPTALRCLERRLQADGAAADVVGATHMLQTVKITADSEAVRGAVAALVASPRWDCLCTGLFVACHCVELCGAGGEVHPDLFDTLCRVIERDLEHQEPRVRGLVAKVLGALCKSERGVSVYGRFQGQLWGSVERHLGSREADTMATNYRGSEEVPLDDVTGWKSLETSLLALVAVAEACAARLEAAGQLERGLWVGVAVEAAVQHQNRYVREAGLGVARALLDACAAPDLPPRLAPLVALGLADPWPQVVFSASRAARSLLANPLGAAELPAVLPRLCMNRYYVPEGVQVHSQQTWEALFAENGGSGRGAVAQQAAAVSAEYVEAMADPRSHFSRVAACYAVRELAAKVDASAVRPHLAPLLSAVFKCLQDNHWEVRSAACSAVGQLAQSFPEATGERAEELLGLCTANLEHESWSIREDAAVALGAAARGIRGTPAVVQAMLQRLRGSILAAKQQPCQSFQQQARLTNDAAAHTGRPAFGCCGGLDSSKPHQHVRPAAPWEVSDGALYLLRELCAEDIRPEGLAEEFMPLLLEVMRMDHFPQADRLRQTAWTVLPQIGQSLGKRTMKRFLDLFTPGLLSALSSPVASRLTRHAAVCCLEDLSRLIGPSIFLARLPEHDRDLFLDLCQDNHDAPAAAAPSVSQFASINLRPSLVSI